VVKAPTASIKAAISRGTHDFNIYILTGTTWLLLSLTAIYHNFW
jgi:hypothetical protein